MELGDNLKGLDPVQQYHKLVVDLAQEIPILSDSHIAYAWLTCKETKRRLSYMLYLEKELCK